MFGMPVICYLFLGGMGAGLCICSSVVALLVPVERYGARLRSRGAGPSVLYAVVPRAYRMLVAPGYLAAAFCVAVGSIMLLVDLGVPNRATLLFQSPTTSLLTVGSFALVALFALSAVSSVGWGLPSSRFRVGILRKLAAASVAAGAVVAAYTGLLLGGLVAVPLWYGPWVPALFVLSSLSCGVAALLALLCFTGLDAVFASLVEHAVRTDALLVALEAFVCLALLATALSGPYAAAADGAAELLGGSLRDPFAFGFIGAGLACPLALDAVALFMRRRTAALTLAGSAGILAGAFALRYCIVMAGAQVSFAQGVMR